MKLKFLAAIFLCGMFYTAAAQQQPATPPAPSTPTPKNPNATVIFSRSDDEASPQTVAIPAPTQLITAKVTDTDRTAITFINYDLDLHLAPRDHSISTRARLRIRNDGTAPLPVIPLQLSSSLNFEGASLDGKRLPFTQQTLNSDTDHTGQLHEAVIQLPAPLAPKSSLAIQVVYSGTIGIDARRLIAIGTPTGDAAASDWDSISADCTGIRGFGNVVWYPVASVPALLGDGDTVFAEIGKQKLRNQDASVSMRLTLEYYAAPPTAIVLDGQSIPVPASSVAPKDNYPGVITAWLPSTKLGFATPSLFITTWPLSESNGLRIYARPEDQSNPQALMTAQTMVQPLLMQWLGSKEEFPLTVIDLPGPHDLAWQQGALLVTAINAQPPESYTGMLASALAHARFQSPRQWLTEGVPNFIETLWIEHNNSRDLALEKLESQRSALAFAEPATPGDAPGEPLIHATDPVYYRTKATYVLWMLRDLAGEKQLAAALQAYDPAADTTPNYFQKLVERASGKDLQWFFDNWVYDDRGLPDLSFVAFHSSPAEHAGQYLVAIDIMNDGFAETEVPVTVISQDSTTLTERVRLPGKTRTVHRILVQGKPTQVIVNDGTVPEVAADIHKRDINEQ